MSKKTILHVGDYEFEVGTDPAAGDDETVTGLAAMRAAMEAMGRQALKVGQASNSLADSMERLKVRLYVAQELLDRKTREALAKATQEEAAELERRDREARRRPTRSDAIELD